MHELRIKPASAGKIKEEAAHKTKVAVWRETKDEVARPACRGKAGTCSVGHCGGVREIASASGS